ncbi:MAG: hypothetical protein QOE83_845 [Actinomycetota bacterium]|nr:hypothetical protein [Actinomycetota bacterium]
MNAERSIGVAPDAAPIKQRVRDRWGRRLALATLCLVILSSLLGTFGARTAVASTEVGGYRLEVTYPATTRPGLPIRWEIAVEHPGGFQGRIQLATTFDYLHLFDISNTEPDAAKATATADDVVYTFASPEGDTFQVSMDGNTEPGLHEVPPATTTLLVGGEPVASVTYATRVVP